MDLLIYLLFQLVALVAPAALIYALVQRAVITITRSATGRSIDL